MIPLVRNLPEDRQEASFIGVPEYLSGKIWERYGIKHEESETKLKEPVCLPVVDQGASQYERSSHLPKIS